MQAPSEMHMSKSTQTSVPHIPNWPGASYGPHTSIPWNFPTGCLFDLNPMSIGPSVAAWSVPVPVNDIVVAPDFIGTPPPPPLGPAAAADAPVAGKTSAAALGPAFEAVWVDWTWVTTLDVANLFSFSASALANVFCLFTGHNCECISFIL